MLGLQAHAPMLGFRDCHSTEQSWNLKPQEMAPTTSLSSSQSPVKYCLFVLSPRVQDSTPEMRPECVPCLDPNRIINKNWAELHFLCLGAGLKCSQHTLSHFPLSLCDAYPMMAASCPVNHTPGLYGLNQQLCDLGHVPVESLPPKAMASVLL